MICYRKVTPDPCHLMTCSARVDYVRTFGLVFVESPIDTWKSITRDDYKEYRSIIVIQKYHMNSFGLIWLLGDKAGLRNLLGLCEIMVLVEGSRSSLSPSMKKRKLNGCPLATSARTLEKIKNVSLRKNADVQDTT